jgi:hypothetical protein
MVNLLSFLVAILLSLTLYYLLFASISQKTITELKQVEAIEINFEPIINTPKKQVKSKNIEKDIAIGSDIGELFQDSDYKKIASKIQRYDITKIKTIDNSKPTNVKELFADKKVLKEDNKQQFKINKEYSSKDKNSDKKHHKYLLLIQQRLLNSWITKPEDVGKKAKIIFKISKSGSFVYIIRQIIGDYEFKSRLIRSLDKLKLSGFEPPNKYTVVTVNFIAKE